MRNIFGRIGESLVPHIVGLFNFLISTQKCNVLMFWEFSLVVRHFSRNIKYGGCVQVRSEDKMQNLSFKNQGSSNPTIFRCLTDLHN